MYESENPTLAERIAAHVTYHERERFNIPALTPALDRILDALAGEQDVDKLELSGHRRIAVQALVAKYGEHSAHRDLEEMKTAVRLYFNTPIGTAPELRSSAMAWLKHMVGIE
jgi:hypothetical protein